MYRCIQRVAVESCVLVGLSCFGVCAWVGKGCSMYDSNWWPVYVDRIVCEYCETMLLMNGDINVSTR